MTNKERAREVSLLIVGAKDGAPPESFRRTAQRSALSLPIPSRHELSVALGWDNVEPLN
jgi:hypothetical protein